MSVRFNPLAPVTRKSQMHAQPPFRSAHRHSLQRASMLTVRAAPVSCFVRLKTWVASICSWFKNLFSRKPAPGNNPGAVALSTANTAGASRNCKRDTTAFARNDWDFSAFQGQDLKDLQYAGNCCDCPKLALYLKKEHRIDLPQACTRINMAIRKAPSSTALTAKFVLENS